ncbi:cell cycle histidine kinase CckA [Methylopila musalis]|uniref:histidine kinase n=1 Tax=Methylopila musalis TaxID=1134781 RepID=A0ABW3Z7W3_9HYPH
MSSVAEGGPMRGEPPIDRSGRSGSVGLVVLLAAALVGAAIAVSFLSGETAQPWILTLLAALSMVGVFALFAGAVGLIQLGGRGARDDLARAIAATSDEGVLVTDAGGRIVYANDAYLDLTRAEGANSARTVERVFAGNADVAEAIYRLSQAARAGRRAHEETRVTLPEGRGAWFRIGVRAIERPGGGGTETVWTLADVTRERERHENVFQELQHAVDFLDHAPAGFFAAEGDGSIVYMNATLAGWLDQDLTRIGVGLRLREILAGDGAALVEAVPAKPGEVATEIIDVDLKARSGRSLPARLLHSVAWAHDGTPGASRTLVLDRGPGADVSEPLRAAEVRFARFFNNTPLAIATVDARGRVIRTNAPFAKLFGDRLRGDAAERSIVSALDGERERGALESAAALAAARAGEVEPVDATLVGDGGRSARLFVTRVDDADGDGEAAVVYALDTTDQRALEAQFAQSQKMQAVGQLAGGVAHDFNNVLTAIIGYSDLLLANHRPTDPSFQDIMQIKQNANRAASLVRQLLAFSRRQTLRPQVIALGDVLAELRMLLSRLLGEKVKLELVHGRDLWLVKADLNQFEQVIINLVVNARDAMADGGVVTIRTRNMAAAEIPAMGHRGLVAADYVMIDVEDTGSGVPAEIIDKIFEPFFSTKEVGKGTGLGLSTVYGIVKQTDGYVFALSEPGKGAVFRIFLPRHVPAEVEEAKPAAVAAAPQDMTGRGTVLLVEDEDAVRAFGARALASRGYTVLEARSGVEALEQMESHGAEVELVVSDVVMPEMDGPSLLRELRKKQPDLKIIFVSGYAEDAFKKNLPEGETFAFLPKPFTLKQLVQAVKETMGG